MGRWRDRRIVMSAGEQEQLKVLLHFESTNCKRGCRQIFQTLNLFHSISCMHAMLCLCPNVDESQSVLGMQEI